MVRGESRNGRVIGDYIAAAGERNLPRDVLEAARLPPTDWMAVAIGASDEDAGPENVWEGSWAKTKFSKCLP